MAKALAVMAQVVAVQQGNGVAMLRNTLFQDTGQRAVKCADPAVQVGLNVGLLLIQLMLGRQVVTAFGNRKGDDARFGIGTLFHQCANFAIPGQHFAN